MQGRGIGRTWISVHGENQWQLTSQCMCPILEICCAGIVSMHAHSGWIPAVSESVAQRNRDGDNNLTTCVTPIGILAIKAIFCREIEPLRVCGLAQGKHPAAQLCNHDAA